MHIIAGLGNPGSKYANNRHNIGFMAADEIVRRHSFSPHSASPWKNKFSAEIAEGTIDGEKVIVMKPLTMMNLSGDSIGKAMRFYKLTPADVTVIYDELDLAPGKVRIKIGGGNGGHNGIRSTENHIGKEFRRVRLGIGHPGHKDRVSGYVLGDFAKSDYDWLDPLLEAFGSEVGLLIAGNESSFMNKLAPAITSDKEKPAKPFKKPQKKGQSHIHQARTANTIGGKRLQKKNPTSKRPEETNNPVSSRPEETSNPVGHRPEKTNNPVGRRPEETNNPVGRRPEETNNPVGRRPEETRKGPMAEMLKKLLNKDD